MLAGLAEWICLSYGLLTIFISAMAFSPVQARYLYITASLMFYRAIFHFNLNPRQKQ